MLMKALFIGQSYIDVTFLADELPTGDEKSVARDFAISFGGNAVQKSSAVVINQASEISLSFQSRNWPCTLKTTGGNRFTIFPRSFAPNMATNRNVSFISQ